MRLRLRDNLPFIEITVVHQRKKIRIPTILVDTGSGGTILSADELSKIDIVPQPEDTLHTIFGVGASEVVFTRTVDELKVGTFSVKQFEVEVGGMDYGFDIQGILGMDFLTSAGARIDLDKLEIEFSKSRGVHG
ncbi:MAG TPA: retropepsin-like aspartic protease [Anaerolineales bacterium]|nr:retropepsin-like aspartic protease [Anaerolineales bacterium]